MIKSKYLRLIILALIIIYILYSFLSLLKNIDRNFWDFKIYYLAVECYNNGIDPYPLENLSLIARTKWELPFLYPPLSLNFFKLFVLNNLNSSIYIFFFIKLLIFMVVLFIWKKILNSNKNLWFLIFILLAFNSTIIKDFTAGNITIFLQFFIWLGIYFYLRQKYVYFNIFILLAASFKIIPILFLGLNLFSQHKNKYYHFFGAVLTFIIYLLLNYLIKPDLFISFINNLGIVFNEKGILNPSSYALIQDIFFNIFKDTYNPDEFKVFELMVYLPLVLIIIFLSIKKYQKIKNSTTVNDPDKKLILIFLYCLTYALILPKFKDYDYTLLILPAFYIILKIKDIPAFYFLMFICLISCINISLPEFQFVYTMMWHYYPLIITIGLWSFYLVMISKWTAKDIR